MYNSLFKRLQTTQFNQLQPPSLCTSYGPLRYFNGLFVKIFKRDAFSVRRQPECLLHNLKSLTLYLLISYEQILVSFPDLYLIAGKTLNFKPWGVGGGGAGTPNYK